MTTLMKNSAVGARRVLVVEDLRLVADLICEYLQSCGFVVVGQRRVCPPPCGSPTRNHDTRSRAGYFLRNAPFVKRAPAARPGTIG